MASSTVRIQDVIDYARTFADLAAVIPVSGFDSKRAFQIANSVMQAMLSSAFKWPWNRGGGGLFVTNSWQQDYAVPGLNNPAFLQDGTLLEINNTAYPKPIWPLEVVQNQPQTSQQFGRPGQISLMFNSDLRYATWGASNLISSAVGPNPQPNQVVTNPIGTNTTPANPWLQIQDANGNFWVLTTFGTLGSTIPPFPSNPVFPTYTSPATVATTQADGTAVWTAVNPSGFGFRLTPLPPQTGVPYQAWPVYQMRPPIFGINGGLGMNQTIAPVPDDFAQFFMDGFVATCYRMVPDPKIREKHLEAEAQWMKSLKSAHSAGDRTRDSAIMYPSQGIMSNGDWSYPNAAMPYGPST